MFNSTAKRPSVYPIELPRNPLSAAADIVIRLVSPSLSLSEGVDSLCCSRPPLPLRHDSLLLRRWPRVPYLPFHKRSPEYTEEEPPYATRKQANLHGDRNRKSAPEGVSKYAPLFKVWSSSEEGGRRQRRRRLSLRELIFWLAFDIS